MALSKPVSYECEFVDKVPEDFFCKQCQHVAREPNITTCCGETYCKACIEAVIQDKKPCPICENSELSTMGLHKKYQARILALKVYCLMKSRGCEWTGQLQDLDAHLQVTTGDCVYVDVDCLSKCNQRVQKRNVKTHLANECLEREHTCRFCHFTATFREVDKHLETCGLYILDCPNRCGVSFERNELEDHLKMCSLQKVQCDFSHTGCEAKFLRNKQIDHSEQSTQKHLSLVAATLRVSQEQQRALKKQLQKVEQKIQEQQQVIEVKDAQIKDLENQQKVLEKKMDEQQKLQERTDKQVQALREEHESRITLLRMDAGLPPYDITFSSYKEKKAAYGYIESAPMYTHPGGYRLKLTLFPNGLVYGIGTHVSVYVYSLKGDHDDKLKFPADLTITLEVLNQHRDQDHYSRDVQCEATEGKIGSSVAIAFYNTFIPHVDLEWNADKQTQYLKNDFLKLRVKRVVVH